MSVSVSVRLISLAIGYLAGCFLTAELAARIAAGRPPEEIGTGNPGMANIMANVGKKAGFAVLAGDLLKTGAAICLSLAVSSRLTGGGEVLFAHWAWQGTAALAVLYSGLGLILGHNFPFWKKFRGGKGVTVTCGWLAVYLFPWGLLCDAVGGIIVLVTGYLPLGAAVIPGLAIPFAFAVYGIEGGVITSAAFLIMLWRHRDGLERVFRGTEAKKLRRKK